MKRLLIIEDDPDEASNLVRNMMKLLEVEAVHSPDLFSARGILQSWRPDVAVIDLKLLDSNPPQTIEALPELSKACPFIVLTGQVGLEADSLRKQAIKNGARNFVQKDHVAAGGWQMLAGIIRDAFLWDLANGRKKTQPLQP